MNVPQKVINHIQISLNAINQFNQEVIRCREIEKQFGQAGRYEYEYRQNVEARIQQSIDSIREFERMAIKNNVNPVDVYVQLGTTPDVEPWSEAALAWVKA